jgi:hypothetical protein
MRIRRSAIALAMLTLVLMPRVGQSQGKATDGRRKVATMSQNYPNPYNPDTHVDFTVGGYPECTDLSKRYRVTMRVFNILTQPVAVPELRGSSSGVAGGQKLQNVSLPCGRYTAFWDGKYAKTGREVASGVYMFALDVDGQRDAVIKSTVAK